MASMMAKQRLFHSLRGPDRRLQKLYKVLCDRRPSAVQRTLGKRMDTQEDVCAIEPQPVHHAMAQELRSSLTCGPKAKEYETKAAEV